MLKKLALVAALAIPALGLAGMSAPAEAKTTFQLYLGVPYYAHQMGPDYRYYPGRGWYRHGPHRGNFGMISCQRGANIVRNNGYRNVRAIDCQGPRYTYRAVRNGKHFTLSLNARSGRLMRL